MMPAAPNTARTRNGVLSVPVIDIAPYRAGRGHPADTGAAAREAVARAVDEAARTVGFMQVTGHGIAPGVRAGLTQAMDAFFALGPEAKARYRCPPGINRGYTPPKAESLVNSLGLTAAGDLFEAFNIGTPAAAFPGLGLPDDVYAANAYPPEVAGFERAAGAWFAAAASVARTMVEIFGTALGLVPGQLERLTDHSVDVLRMINYRLPSAAARLEPDQAGMGAHTDYGIVTVLWADQVPGLEILGSGGRWHPVQPAGNALLVNLGDALARLTNDQWLSTMHRVAPPVVNGVLVPRRSAAFFHDGNWDAVIAPLPGCVDNGHPARYEPVTVARHLAQKLAGSRAGVLNSRAEREAARLARR
jgi:isopenicillin N synthase-like dioxygenase